MRSKLACLTLSNSDLSTCRYFCETALPCADPIPKWEKKMAEPWILDPPGKRGEKWPRNGKIGPKMGSKNGNFPIFRPLFLFFSGGAKIHFVAIFVPFAASGPKWGRQPAQNFSTMKFVQIHRKEIFSRYLYLLCNIIYVQYDYYLLCGPPLNCKEQLCLHVLRKLSYKIIPFTPIFFPN